MRHLFSSSVALGLGMLVHAAHAQDDIQRVHITGSSIKRIAAEGALPVQTLTRAQIDQSGVTSVADLVAMLPAMQGFTTASSSVNGGGSGVQTASLHGIGEGYTLVLLNGRRMAPATSGSTVNLAGIPLSAVERVEILADGASTLYGSDAIAGVVNFILKKDQQALVIEAGLNRPQDSGGRSHNISITKGWGDFDKDGYNLMLSAARDEQRALHVSQREFSQSGVIPFTQDGKRYALYRLSTNAQPGRATVRYLDAAGQPNSVVFTPDYLATGKCNGMRLYLVEQACQFDFTSLVQALPEHKRDSLFGSANVKLGERTTLFAELVGARFDSIAQYAPLANGYSVPVGSIMYNKSVAPYLERLGISPGQVSGASMNVRLLDAGGRTNDFRTDVRHLTLGLDGSLAKWDYTVSYTHSQNKASDSAVGGYVDNAKFQALLDSGAYDPFAPAGKGEAILAPIVLHKQVSATDSRLDVFNARGSTSLFALPGGSAQLGVGADASRQSYQYDPDLSFSPGSKPVDAHRRNWGSYAELLLPLAKQLDLTAAARYDSYSAVSNAYSDSGSQGNAASKATYKLALRYRPLESLLLRASYGTGFKVADLTSIVNPLQDGGASGFHTCPITNRSDPRFALCFPGSTEYTLLTGGNPFKGEAGLKPEQSKQSSIGLRFEPVSQLSLGLDWWDVRLTNQIQTLSEDVVFDNPAQYDALFRTYYNPIQKLNVLAAALTPFNLASSRFQGVDWDHTLKLPTAVGKLGVHWSGTYMLKSEQEAPDAGIEENIGRFNSYANVTFRVISRLAATLATSERWAHTAALQYRSGYTDQVYSAGAATVVELKDDGSAGSFVAMRRRVSSYTTLDLQSKLNWNATASLTFGIRNLLDRAPPFTIRTAGGGNQSGYDGRYADALGRQFYLRGSYRF
ncbi:TonB-dependent receptor [Pseudoduganella sp. DS3]|uniref:TonB-dependent receptor n=1 Tax=Pseudoduganella guangdongensis TaxID=2692179 RepID=A0A6N9HDI8_9BURK|nr:TonB-dependent receptor [Pseudoduganella guangdongensis]MYN01574.1 TonB-dependent receptor [Pseudoduganella guangdongensis]